MNKLTTDLISGNSVSNQRPEPERVGIGLEISEFSEKSENHFSSDFRARLDLICLEFDTNSNNLPSQSTPAIHVTSHLKFFNSNGEQDWLLGGPTCENRLKSMETKLIWRNQHWDADIRLEGVKKRWHC